MICRKKIGEQMTFSLMQEKLYVGQIICWINDCRANARRANDIAPVMLSEDLRVIMSAKFRPT